MPPAITLTTDFGQRDPYVAAMKGVICARTPQAPIHDLSHDLPAGDIFEAALFLAGAAPWFPEGTIHVVVIDPGVGTDRLPIVAQWDSQLLVLPDNGLITFLHRNRPVDAVHRITNPQCLLEQVSDTFHGRDLFAPTATALAGGLPIADVGDEVKSPALLPVPEPRSTAEGVAGEVIHVDRFGNAVTNIPREALREPSHVQLNGAGAPIPFARTYGEVAADETLALVGSGGLLEIAVNRGNAAERLGLRRGSTVFVRCD